MTDHLCVYYLVYSSYSFWQIKKFHTYFFLNFMILQKHKGILNIWTGTSLLIRVFQLVHGDSSSHANQSSSSVLLFFYGGRLTFSMRARQDVEMKEEWSDDLCCHGALRFWYPLIHRLLLLLSSPWDLLCNLTQSNNSRLVIDRLHTFVCLVRFLNCVNFFISSSLALLEKTINPHISHRCGIYPLFLDCQRSDLSLRSVAIEKTTRVSKYRHLITSAQSSISI